MWDFAGEEVTWPRIDHLRPEHVLDEYDGPRLFTLRAEGGLLLLAYQCAEDATGERFLLVPAGPDLIDAIERNDIPLRTALLRAGWAWIVDRRRDGGCSPLRRVDAASLPATALPAEDAYLSPTEPPFLHLRLSGPAMGQHHVSASIVRQALTAASDALRLLVGQAQSERPAGGRPPEAFRRLYDLPATGFAFGSFSITFASPQSVGQGGLDDPAILEVVGTLLRRGLAWASAAEDAAPGADAEWRSIVEALAKLAPPLRGSVSEVEVGGALVASGGGPTRLTQAAAERIRAARKLLASARTSRTLEGQVREFDKDKLTFILRDAAGGTLGSVSFSEQHYDDVWTAFDTDRKVVIIADPFPSGQTLDLVSISFVEPASPPDDATA